MERGVLCGQRSWAAPGYTAGQLLVRLTPGGGSGAYDPDEQAHVGRMKLLGLYEDQSNEEPMYAEFFPQPGTLLVFPGFLSHAVAPHFGDNARVSVSFNIFLDNQETNSSRSENSDASD